MNAESYLRKLNILSLLLSVSFLVIILGGSFNNLVIQSNGNRMPVLISYVSNNGISTTKTNFYFFVFKTNKINYPYLIDRFYFHNRIYSLGDIFLLLGMIFFATIMFLHVYYYKKYYVVKSEQ